MNIFNKIIVFVGICALLGFVGVNKSSAQTITPIVGGDPIELSITRLQSIIRDGFSTYSNGSVVGQGSWTSYVNGNNFLVQEDPLYSYSKVLYNNAQADSVVTKAGTPLSDGRQSIYIRTEHRNMWGDYSDGNAQVRISKGSWASGAPGLSFAAVSFKKNGSVAYYDPIADVYRDFETYSDNEWTLLKIEWRSSDKMARYKINNGTWTDWSQFANSASFTNFDNVGLGFNSVGGSGGVYFDTLF